MANFSSSVMLGDLNDFISPSQACINPLFVGGDKKDKNENQTPPQDSASGGIGLPKIGLVIENDFNTVELSAPVVQKVAPAPMKPDLIKSTEKKTAKVSLTDCLACSGCVTSAETVLIEQQSTSEFLTSIQSSKYAQVVVTLSYQSLASLATHFGCSSVEIKNKLEAFLATLGVTHTIDTSCASDFALLETAGEFVQKYKNRMNQSAEASAPKMPILSSACPGWICFAEKRHPEVLPYISSTMSPQEISGVLVKRFMTKIHGVDSSKVYHCTVMPCPDKKLEASRQDFYNPDALSNDVDCVLTTNELLQLLTERGINSLNSFPVNDRQDAMEIEGNPLSLEDLSTCSVEGNRLVSAVSSNGGSGGYLDFVFRYAAKELFNVEIKKEVLPLKRGRNVDMKTIELRVGDKVVLNFAMAYGFRNIQSIIRQMKRKKCQFDFVEIMACPGGCLNGGGQIKASDPMENNSPELLSNGISSMEAKLSEKESNRILLEKVRSEFHNRSIRETSKNQILLRIYSELVGGDPYSAKARKLLHTQYHEVTATESFAF
mmetsp:Transcript_4784/g.5909  ORF Transcript_4784/g.5909 Transcript_4784/m.5909 type:complete len:547 (+) Transcript_4784:102-1742(+)